MKENKTTKTINDLMQILLLRHIPGRPASNGIFIVNLAGFRPQ